MPWLPIANVGSVLVLAHFHPGFKDTLGLPEGTFFKVTIGFEEYRKHQQACLQTLGESAPNAGTGACALACTRDGRSDARVDGKEPLSI
jgi:hypothetical protein